MAVHAHHRQPAIRARLTILCLAMVCGWQIFDGMARLRTKGYRRQPAPVAANAPSILTQPAFGMLAGLLQSPDQRLAGYLGNHYALYTRLRDELDQRAVIAISAKGPIDDWALQALPLRLRNLLYPRIVAPLTLVREYLASGWLDTDRPFYVLHLGATGPALPSESYQRIIRTEHYEFGRYVGFLGGGR